jgi:integrase
MRDRTNRDRSRSQPVFEIVMLLPGSAVAEGAQEPDRFRCSSETRSAKLHAKHREMVAALYQRGRVDVLRARLGGHFTTTQLYVAFSRGEQAVNELMCQAVPRVETAVETRESLRDAIEEYLAFNTGRDDAEKPRERRLMHRYAEWVEAQSAAHGKTGYVATVDDLTPEQVSRYLNGLRSVRHGRGHPCAAATKNRNRASLGGLATRLVQRGLLTKHFIKDGGLKPFVEAPSRLPDLTPEERAAYLADIERRTPEFLPVFHLLMNTGADLGEVLSRRVRDVSFGERLTRIDFRRTKTDTDPRQVPLHPDYAALLREHIEKRALRLNARIFSMFPRCQISDSHERARTAIGRGTLREMTIAAKRESKPAPSPDEIDVLRIKDLRHVSAIAWARAGVRLERISDWLGHADIRMTRIYARFMPADDYDAPFIDRAREAVKPGG